MKRACHKRANTEGKKEPILYHFTYMRPLLKLMEKAMATHSSTFAWRIPWMEEPHRLQSMGSLRVGHDSVTSLSLFTFTHWRKQWQPTPILLPGESQGQRSLLGAVYGVTQSRTRLMPLSKSSSLMVEDREIEQRRQWYPTPVLLPGKSHGQRSLVGCSPWSLGIGHD